MQNLKWIKKHGKAVQGKREYIDYLEGKRLSPVKAIRAAHYNCTLFDGRRDCEVVSCPLYLFQPFRKDKEQQAKRPRSAKQIEAGRKLSLLRSTARSSTRDKQSNASDMDIYPHAHLEGA